MSGRPQDQYDDGAYGHQGNAADPRGANANANTDSYYQDEQNQGYYDDRAYTDDRGHPNQAAGAHPQGADGYYDES